MIQNNVIVNKQINVNFFPKNIDQVQRNRYQPARSSGAIQFSSPNSSPDPAVATGGEFHFASPDTAADEAAEGGEGSTTSPGGVFLFASPDPAVAGPRVPGGTFLSRGSPFYRGPATPPPSPTPGSSPTPAITSYFCLGDRGCQIQMHFFLPGCP